MPEYQCKHCEGICEVIIVRNTEKATEPTIEFCPFCGISNQHPKEPEEKKTDKKK